MPYFPPNMVGPDQLMSASRSAPQGIPPYNFYPYGNPYAVPQPDPYAEALQNANSEYSDPNWAAGYTPAQLDYMGQNNFVNGLEALGFAGGVVAPALIDPVLGIAGIGMGLPVHGIAALPYLWFRQDQDARRRRTYGESGNPYSSGYTPDPRRRAVPRSPQQSYGGNGSY